MLQLELKELNKVPNRQTTESSIVILYNAAMMLRKDLTDEAKHSAVWQPLPENRKPIYISEIIQYSNRDVLLSLKITSVAKNIF